MLTTEQWLYLIGSIFTLMGAYITARLGFRANRHKANAEREVSGGRLALDYATRLDDENDDLRAELGGWRRWWRTHDRWDRTAHRRLEQADPAAAEMLGEAPPPPDEETP